MSKSSEIYRALAAVAQSRQLKEDQVVQILSQAIKFACREVFGYDNIEARVDPTQQSIDVYRVWSVVDEVKDPHREYLKQQLPASLQEETSYLEPIELAKLGRNFTSVVGEYLRRQIIQKKYESLTEQIAQDGLELLRGQVVEVQPHALIVQLSKYDLRLLLPKKHLLMTDRFLLGDQVKAVGVYHHSQQKLLLSRSHQNFVLALAREEVPEFSEGVITVASIARKPGWRCKIALQSAYLSKMLIIPTFIGFKGHRLLNLSKALHQEKLDISLWDDNYQQTIRNSYASIDIPLIEELPEFSVLMVAKQDLPRIIGYRGINIFLTGQLVKRKLKAVALPLSEEEGQLTETLLDAAEAEQFAAEGYSWSKLLLSPLNKPELRLKAINHLLETTRTADDHESLL